MIPPAVETRTYYPNNLKLIFLESLIPVALVLLAFLFQGGLNFFTLRFASYYYIFALVHYLYLQPLKIDNDSIEGPGGFLFVRRKIAKKQAVFFEEKVLFFRLIRIRDADTGRTVIFFTNYFLPSTVREIETLLNLKSRLITSDPWDE